MSNLYNKIKDKLNCLPIKDARLCNKYFEERNFESILEIVKSDLVMREKEISNPKYQNKWQDIDVLELEDLMVNIQDYLSEMGISYLTEEDYNE